MFEGQVVEHGGSLRMRKQAILSCVVMLERERKIAIRLLISGSGGSSPSQPAYGKAEW